MATLDTREFTHEGRDYRVRIVADTDASPSDYYRYSAEDISAFNNGEWRYVGVILYTHKPGSALESVTSLWAVEYGSIGDASIGTDEIVQRIKDEDCWEEQ